MPNFFDELKKEIALNKQLTHMNARGEIVVELMELVKECDLAEEVIPDRLRFYILDLSQSYSADYKEFKHHNG